MMIRLVIQWRRPKISDARVPDLSRDYYYYRDKPSPRKFRQASVEYFYRSKRYTAKILLKSRPQAGEHIVLLVHPENPEKTEEYYPLRKFAAALVVLAIGAGLIYGSWIIKESLDQ